MKVLEERDVAHVGDKTCTFRTDDIKHSAEFREAYEHALNVISAEDQPFEQSPDGLIKHLVHEKMGTREHCVDAYMLFLKEGERSGKHRHQGGLVIYVIIGKGYSVVDGERVDWQAGDLLLLPIKPGGVEHQHFNLQPGQDCRWIAFSYMPFFDHVASEFTQTELSPLFKAQNS